MRASGKQLVLATMLCGLVVSCGDEYRPRVDRDAGPTPDARGTTSVEFVNRTTSTTITGLYVSPSNADDWGDNQLDADTIAPGARWTLGQVPCNRSFDVRVVGTSSFNAQEDDLVFDCGKSNVLDITR